MDNIKCLSEVLGIVRPEEIFAYLDKNWRRISYNETIVNMLKKFEDSLGNGSDEKRRRVYEFFKEQWDKTISSLRYDESNGHLSSCRGVIKCDCCTELYTIPREFIGRIVHAYTPTQCIIEQMTSGCRIEDVLVNFRINWRKMDMRNVMKKLLSLLSGKITPNELGSFRENFFVKFYEPVLKHHDNDGECEPYFYHGLVTCDCIIRVTCNAPREFIEKMIIAYYTRRTSSKPHPCHICDTDYDHLHLLTAHIEKKHFRCSTCNIYLSSNDSMQRSSHAIYCSYFCLNEHSGRKSNSSTDDDSEVEEEEEEEGNFNNNFYFY